MSQTSSDMQFSDDGQWWWDGRTWWPAFTPDGKWRFDGTAWQRVRGPLLRRPPIWLIILAAFWCIALGAWLPTAVATLRPDAGPDSYSAIYLTCGALAVATIGLGCLIAWKSQLAWLWPLAAAGVVLQMFSYVAAMLEVPQPGGVEDDAAAAGFVILFVPVLVVILALLWSGVAMTLGVRAIRRTRAKAAAAD